MLQKIISPVIFRILFITVSETIQEKIWRISPRREIFFLNMQNFLQYSNQCLIIVPGMITAERFSPELQMTIIRNILQCAVNFMIMYMLLLQQDICETEKN